MSTPIEWTDETDNIITVLGGGWWCRMCSPGCAHCYAAKLNQNAFYGGNKLAYSGPVPPLVLKKELIDGWARQRKARRHFVASMTDVFGDWVPREWIEYFLDGMRAAPLQTFQVLTKRPEVAAAEIAHWLELHGLEALPVNIWIGTSVENQEWADKRIPWLLKIPAAVRFLSVEPLLGEVHLAEYFFKNLRPTGEMRTHGGKRQIALVHEGLTNALQWVIVGGESGKEARPCQVRWINIIVKQCASANVPCFVKQLGSNPILSAARCRDCADFGPVCPTSGFPCEGLKHKKGGDMEEWPEGLRVREFPEVANL